MGSLSQNLPTVLVWVSLLMCTAFSEVATASDNNHPNNQEFSFQVMSCRAADSLALVDFYTKANGDLWLNSWDLSQPMDSWFGIKLNDDGCVSCIDLDGVPDCDISVSIGNGLTSTLSEKIGDLASLTHLLLGNNQLNSTIPDEIFKNSAIEVLDLYANSMIGPLPASVGDATNLHILSLSNNDFMGTIPSNIGNLQNLETLLLNSNSFTGSIPREVTMLASLVRLRLDNNSLTGFVPMNIGDMKKLNILNFADNNIIGPLPESIKELTNLRDLIASNNLLSNEIPVEIGALAELRILRLDFNNIIGPLPSSIGNLGNLQNLTVNDNEIIGPLPEQIGECTELLQLKLYNNKIDGTLPPEIGDLAKVRLIDISNNLFTGPLPASISGNSNLQELFLETNGFTGPLPASIGDVASLRRLLAADNDFIGPLPASLKKIEMLYEIDLENNEIDGEVPSELGELPSLFRLNLNNNKLEGCFPETFADDCNKEYSFNNNTRMPWLGNFSTFCSGEEQIDAKCSTETNTPQETILDDCTCGVRLCSDVELSVDALICHGSNITIAGNEYNESGIVIDSLISEFGCDSVLVYNLASMDFKFEVQPVICFGENTGSILVSSEWINGSYDYVLRNKDGQIVSEGIDQSDLPAFTETLAEGEYALTIAEESMGCNFDTVFQIITLTPEEEPTILDGAQCKDMSFTINENVYNSENPTGSEILKSSQGCDSLVIIDLFYFDTPVAKLDSAQTFKNKFTLDVLSNDSYDNADYIDIEITEKENIDEVIVLADGSIQIELTEEATGPYSLTYKICLDNCAEECSTAEVQIRKVELSEFGYDTDIMTPNDDGYNDFFIIEGYEENELVLNATLTVINRWGEIVFSSENYRNDWTGNLHNQANKPLPEGVYYYHLLYDTGISRMGSRSIIR